jgi:hypothetical protein
LTLKQQEKIREVSLKLQLEKAKSRDEKNEEAREKMDAKKMKSTHSEQLTR